MSDRRASLSRVIPITTDTGTGYGRPPPTSRRELAEVGPGTSMGELLRRYWHPVGLAADAASVPRKVRALGEDLVLFRDGQQRPGLVLPHCIHRGASLFYGTTEERGIRCCDHGWLFDVHGHCLEQPWEPGGGRARDKLRQPWYPVQELYGLLWAYMGPPEKKPVLPRYECLEVLDEGEFLEADDSSLGGGGPAVVDCNWLQHFETLVDPFHGTAPHPAQAGAAAAAVSDVSWDTTEISVRAVALHRLPDGRKWRRISEAGLPTLRVVPDPRPGRLGPVESVGWALPIDDTHFRIYTVGRVRAPGELDALRARPDGRRRWEDLSEVEHQRHPGDYEAMVSRGAIAHHSEEHLVSSDRGVVMLRRMLQRQLDIVQQGGDPAGVSFDPDAPLVRFSAGNWLDS